LTKSNRSDVVGPKRLIRAIEPKQGKDTMTGQLATEQFEQLSADALIDRIFAENGGAPCITCSFQAEDMIVLDLLRKRRPEIPVLFLDTGYHFAETYAYRDKMQQAWHLNLTNLAARKSVAQQESEFGILNQTDPGKCCHLRKVEPLMDGLQNYDVWFTGLRREQSPTRKNLKVVEHHELPSGKVLLKVSPLAAWTWGQVWKYTAENKIDFLPLYDLGYRSIGCEPCTAIPVEGADARTGRWGGKKLECGIHTFSKKADE
jgi:phosphoadenosine phosphosulfate reductase